MRSLLRSLCLSRSVSFPLFFSPALCTRCTVLLLLAPCFFQLLLHLFFLLSSGFFHLRVHLPLPLTFYFIFLFHAHSSSSLFLAPSSSFLLPLPFFLFPPPSALFYSPFSPLYYSLFPSPSSLLSLPFILFPSPSSSPCFPFSSSLLHLRLLQFKSKLCLCFLLSPPSLFSHPLPNMSLSLSLSLLGPAGHNDLHSAHLRCVFATHFPGCCFTRSFAISARALSLSLSLSCSPK